MTLLRTAPRARALDAEEMSYSVDAGTRWAWLLEDDLASLYADQISSAYATAAERLDRVAAHSPAGGLAAAAGWSVPDPDELGLSLRELQDRLHETGETGVPQRDEPDAETAIRVEALRRTTAAGLELMNISFDAKNPLLRGALAQRGQNIGIAATTRKEIMASLNASWEDGDSIPKAAKRLRAAAPDVAKTRSTMIARTELIGVINGGAHALGSLSNEIAAENGEPVLLKIWLTAEDERVRDSHAAAGAEYGEGSGIAMDDAFRVGESEMLYPGDPDGAAEDVINCRCALSYEEAGAEAPAAAIDEDAPAEAETPEFAPITETKEELLAQIALDQAKAKGAPQAARAAPPPPVEAPPPTDLASLARPSTWEAEANTAETWKAYDKAYEGVEHYPRGSSTDPVIANRRAGVTALRQYSGSYYARFNSYLRGKASAADAPFEAETIDGIETMKGLYADDAIALALPEDAVLYRGMSIAPGETLVGQERLDLAFMSTTLKQSVAEGFALGRNAAREKIILRLHAPAGTRVLPGGLKSEAELILAPGRRYVVVDEAAPIRVAGRDVRTFNAVLLPEAS